MSKHTQAPWITKYKPCCNLFELTASNGEEILCNHYVGDEFDGDHYGAVKKEADARLIAAAPELLEALKALTHSLDLADLIHDDQRAAFQAGIAAIAKAEGQS
jgi:hypothetical protein